MRFDTRRFDTMRLFSRAVAVACAIVGLSEAVNAQTYFTPPSHQIAWSRYTMPEACREATNRARLRAAREDQPETYVYNLFDTLPSVVVNAARQCLTRAPVAKVESQSLPVLLDLALIARDTVVFDAVVARQLAEVKTSSHRAHAAVIVQAMTAVTRARPVPVALAQHYVAMVDSLWPRAVMERAKLHLGPVLFSHDPAEIVRLLRAALAIAQSPSPEPSTEQDQQEIRLLEYGIQYNAVMAKLLHDGPTDSVVAQLRAAIGGMQGQQLDSITGQFHYPAMPNEPAVFPIAGRPSLIMLTGYQCGASCLPMYAAARRVHERFPTLPIVLATTTRGAFRGQLASSATEEAGWIRDYFRNDLKLPFSILIDTVPHTKRPDPDRRQITAFTATGARYQQTFNNGHIYDGSLLLTDAKGRVVLWNIGGDNNGEWMLTKVIERLLSSPATP